MKLIDKILANDDDEMIRTFYNCADSDALVSFYLRRFPPFSAALQVEGDDSKIISVLDEDRTQIAGALILTEKVCYLEGQERSIGYLGSAKIKTEYRGGLVLARITRNLHIQMQADPKIGFCSLMKGNRVAHEIFLSGRKALPKFRHISGFKTMIFKPVKKKTGDDESLKIISANQTNIGDLVRYLNTEGKAKQLFPVYKSEHFTNPGNGLLKGIETEKVYIAMKNDKITGTLAVWDQTAFRQWVISGKKPFSILKPLVNLVLKIRGIPVLPARNKGFGSKYISLVCIRNNEPEVFEKLLGHAMIKELESDSKSVLVMGFPDNDPMFSKLKIRAITLKSDIYAFAWSEHLDDLNAINFNNLYIETGAL